MSPCEICEVEAGTLRCSHIGPLCFDCWGSGIHEAMRWKVESLPTMLSAEEFARLICLRTMEVAS
jgi:hypothetical protein